MADQELVRILKNGVQDWNRWRRHNPDRLINLTEADLSGVDLSYADLSRSVLWKADLSTSSLRRVDFRGSKMENANLSNSDLRESIFYDCVMQNANFYNSCLINANFKKSILSEANLTKCMLSNTDFSKSLLFRTNFTEADLRYSNFFNAYLSSTIFNYSCLEGAKNLNRTFHLGPSSIDINTLTMSGRLPSSFLTGVGMNHYFIRKYSEFFSGGNNYYHRCFLHVSKHDLRLAHRLQEYIIKQGISCWLLEEDIDNSAEICAEIKKLSFMNSKSLLVLSVHSIHSDWLHRIINIRKDFGLSNGLDLLFILADDAVYENGELSDMVINKPDSNYDLSNWKKNKHSNPALENLLSNLKI